MNDTTLTAVLVVALVGAAAYYLGPQTDSETGESDQAPDLQDYANQAVSMFESDDMSNPNLTAFLRALRVGEGTSGPNGYSTLMGGGLFDSYADHPALLGWRGTPLSDAMCRGAGFGPGCVSTAAGAYQITKPTWVRVAAKLGLSDFSPASQDAAAIELISEKGALGDIQAGRIDDAVSKVRRVWASLPGAGYSQAEVKLAAFANNFQKYGGTLA
jgi:lysozyme